MLQSVQESPAESQIFVRDWIAGAADLKKPQPITQRQHRKSRQPEIGHREKEQGDSAERTVNNRTPPCHLDQRDENAKCEASDERDTHKQQGIRQRRPQYFEHRTIVGERPAQLAVDEGAGVAGELLGKRSIQTVLRAQSLTNALAYIRIVEYRAERIPGREMDKSESDGGDNRYDHRRLSQPSREVADHPYGAFCPAG